MTFIKLEEYVNLVVPEDKQGAVKNYDGILSMAKPAEETRKLLENMPKETELQSAISDNELTARRRPWTKDEFPFIYKWVGANEKAFDAFSKAAVKPGYYFPILSPSKPAQLYDADFEYVSIIRQMSNGLSCRAMSRIAEGDYKGAWEDSLTLHNISRLMADPISFIGREVLIMAELNSIEVDKVIIDAENVDPELLREMHEEIENLKPIQDMADNVDIGLRFYNLDIVMSLIRAGKQAGPKVMSGQPDALNFTLIMLRINTYYDSLVNAIKSDEGYFKTKEHIDRVEAQLPEIVKKSKARNTFINNVLLFCSSSRTRYRIASELIGDLLLVTSAPSVVMFYKNQFEHEASLRMLRIALALRLYKIKNGNYPEKLSGLVPDYFDKTPLDPYADTAFGFKRTGEEYLLYSTGPDCVDNKGNEETDHVWGYDEEDGE